MVDELSLIATKAADTAPVSRHWKRYWQSADPQRRRLTSAGLRPSVCLTKEGAFMGMGLAFAGLIVISPLALYLAYCAYCEHSNSLTEAKKTEEEKYEEWLDGQL